MLSTVTLIITAPKTLLLDKGLFTLEVIKLSVNNMGTGAKLLELLQVMAAANGKANTKPAAPSGCSDAFGIKQLLTLGKTDRFKSE